MAWSQSNVEIRLISTGWGENPPELFAPFVAAEIRNDACAPSSRRWEITAFAGNEPVEYPWYRVITPDDTDRDIRVSLEHAVKVWHATNAVRDAQRALQALL